MAARFCAAERLIMGLLPLSCSVVTSAAGKPKDPLKILGLAA
jgi:hypothetical protein